MHEGSLISHFEVNYVRSINHKRGIALVHEAAS